MKFLPNVGMSKLVKIHRRKKDQKAKTRLLICIHAKKGRSTRRIAEDIGMPQATVSY